MTPRHTKSTIPRQATKIPDPRPIVTKWFIAVEGDKPYDDREFDAPEDAHKARGELENKTGTYIHSYNHSIDGKRVEKPVAK